MSEVLTGYKLTTQENTTHGDFKWRKGVWRVAKGKGVEPCTGDVLHYYESPLLAILMNPRHANIQNPRLWVIERDERIGTDGLKSWCKKQRIVREAEIPQISTDDKIRFAILCALEIYKEPGFVAWADGWISGKDRSSQSAYRAYASAAWASANAAAAANAYASAAWASAASAAYAANHASKGGLEIDFAALAELACTDALNV